MKKRDTLKDSSLIGDRGQALLLYSLLSYAPFAADFLGFSETTDSVANQFSINGNLLLESAAS